MFGPKKFFKIKGNLDPKIVFERYILQKYILQKYSGPNKNVEVQKFFYTPKIYGLKNHWVKKIVAKKNFGTLKFSGQTFIGTQHSVP